MSNNEPSRLDYSLIAGFNIAAATVSTLVIGNAYVGYHAANELMSDEPPKHPGLLY